MRLARLSYTLLRSRELRKSVGYWVASTWKVLCSVVGRYMIGACRMYLWREEYHLVNIDDLPLLMTALATRGRVVYWLGVGICHNQESVQ